MKLKPFESGMDLREKVEKSENRVVKWFRNVVGGEVKKINPLYETNYVQPEIDPAKLKKAFDEVHKDINKLLASQQA